MADTPKGPTPGTPGGPPQPPAAGRPATPPKSAKPAKVQKEDTSPYGAAELKRVMRPNLIRGISVSTLLHVLPLAGAVAYTYYKSQAVEEADTAPVVVNYAELPPPPPIDEPPSVDPAPAPPTPVEAPSVGIPEPVPDEEADPEQTLATQEELNAPTGDIGVGVGVVGGTGTDQVAAPPPPPPPPADGPPPEFVPVEKQPTPIEQVQPEYPEIARRAGIEGRVIVRVWVSKEGRVKDVQVQRSDNEIFNDNAVAAVRRWRFEPAIQAGNPVDVWVSIPIRFKQR